MGLLRGAVLLLPFLVASCFSIDRRGGILRHSGGLVTTGYGHFTVGRLPSPWQGPKIRLKQLVYENDDLGATIVADALCGPKFDDAPLARLARDLFSRLERKKLEREKRILLEGRAAVRLRGAGLMDGVPIQMDVVVMKKDLCLFDLVYFAPPATFAKGVADFEGYLDDLEIR